MKFKAEESMTNRICSLLREEIFRGHLHPGEKIESIRSLARRFSVSSQVLVSVFKVLAEEKLVFSRPGSGYFVSEVLPEKLRPRQYRIGFLNWKMPITEKFPLECFCTLIRQAERLDIQIFLNSGDQVLPLAEWERTNKLDAVIATGKVDDALVRSLKKLKVPFLILGNYLLAEKANILESTVAEDVEEKITILLQEKKFRKVGALLHTGLRSSEEIKKGIFHAAEKNNIGKNRCFFFETEETGSGEGLKGMRYFLKEKKFGKNDLIFLNPDCFNGCARYIFENGIQEKVLPHLLLEMASSSQIPFPELAGSFLYDKEDPLSSHALNCMLDILSGRIKKNTVLLVRADGTMKIKPTKKI